MKLNQRISLTPSEVMEYLYCPRYIYFMKYLRIPQREKKRYKVKMGNEYHEKKQKVNKEYLRKKIGVVDKLLNQNLYSERYGIHGVVDEIIFLNDGTAASLDYKYSKYKNRIFKTQKYQAAMYAMLISDNYQIPVKRSYIVFIRSKNLLQKIEINNELIIQVQETLSNIVNIIQRGYYPNRTEYVKRCDDCTYRNICIM